MNAKKLDMNVLTPQQLEYYYSVKSLRYKTAAQEKLIELYEKMMGNSGKKFLVGDGVSFKVASSRRDSGRRYGQIVAINLEKKEATIQLIGTYTRTGGNDLPGIHIVPFGLLNRSHKYDKGY